MANQYLLRGVKGKVGGYISEDNPMPVLETDYGDTLYYYDGGGNIEYICQHSVSGTALSADDWIITKLTYVTNNIVSRERLVGSVDGKDALAWR